jgi:hypothetical protein
MIVIHRYQHHLCDYCNTPIDVSFQRGIWYTFRYKFKRKPWYCTLCRAAFDHIDVCRIINCAICADWNNYLTAIAVKMEAEHVLREAGQEKAENNRHPDNIGEEAPQELE